MPYLSQSDIPENVRVPHLEQYRERLKRDLQSPVLTSEQRVQIKKLLQQAGQPVDYSTRETPVGALPLANLPK